MRPTSSSLLTDQPDTSVQSPDTGYSTSSSTGSSDLPAPPRMQSSQPNRSSDVMQIDTDDPEQAPSSPRSRKRTLAESEPLSPETEVSTEPQFKRSRIEPPDAEQPLALVSDGSRPWHRDVQISDDKKWGKQLYNLFSAIRSNASPATINKILFGENSPWRDQTFKTTVLHIIFDTTDLKLDLLKSCGAFILSTFHMIEPSNSERDSGRPIVIIGKDFDHEKLVHGLKFGLPEINEESSENEPDNDDTKHLVKSLDLAAQWGDVSIVQELLSLGARFDPEDWDAGPLMLATYAGHTSIVQKLIEAGANVHAMDVYDWSALTVAAHQGSEEMCKLLLAPTLHPDYVPTTPFVEAAKAGHLSICRLIVDRFPSIISGKSSCGFDALENAIEAGHEEIARWLIEKGVDVHDCDSFDGDLLSKAAASGNLSLFKFLLGLGVDAGSWEDTPLMAAASRSHLEIVNFILSQGVEIDRSNGNGRTALHLACASGSAPVVEALLKNGASLDVIDCYGENALAYAVKSLNLDVVRYLGSQHANFRRQDRYGKDAIQLVLKWLLDFSYGKLERANDIVKMLTLLMDFTGFNEEEIRARVGLFSEKLSPLAMEIIDTCIAVRFPANAPRRFSELDAAQLMSAMMRELDPERLSTAFFLLERHPCSDAQ